MEALMSDLKKGSADRVKPLDIGRESMSTRWGNSCRKKRIRSREKFV